MLALTCFFGLKNLVINLNVLVNNNVCEYVHVVFRSLAKDAFSVRHFFSLARFVPSPDEAI